MQGLDVLGYCYFFWRTSRHNGVYNVPGFSIRPAGPGQARFVGTQPEVDAVWLLGRYFSPTASYSYFAAGPFIRDSPPARDIQYVASWLTFKF